MCLALEIGCSSDATDERSPGPRAGGAGHSEDGGAGAGGGGDAGAAGGTDGGEAIDAATADTPALLSRTGLFTSVDATGALVLADGVMPFEPKYWLWSDGSGKKRWVYLPPGSTIDVSDPDHWQVPVGAKFWKEFSPGGRRVETRLIERVGAGPDDFVFAAYLWESATSKDATLVPAEETVIGAAGTSHDIPSQDQCHRCHDGLKEHVLGFSALQLSHDLPGVTVKSLTEQGRFEGQLPSGIQLPGDAKTQAALGYLHANCGNCHNDSPGIPVEGLPEPQMYLRVLVGDGAPEDTGVYKTAVNKKVTKAEDLGFPLRIAGGDPEKSAVAYRMSVRYTEDQMPPIATNEVDKVGSEAVNAWISTLPHPK
jgi:hypothetical protein